MADESASVLDFVGVDIPAAATTEASVETPIAETPTAETTETPTVETPETKVETKTEKAQQYNSDGSPKEAEVKAEDDGKEFGEKTPQDVRKALSAFKNSSPEAAKMAKLLHGSYERWEAARAIFPGGVNEIKAAREFSDLVGGHEGFEALTSLKERAEASDNQLYEGNGELIKDIVEDLKAHNKLDALGKLAPSFLEAVKANDEAGFKTAFAPHFLAGLETANLPGALEYLVKALNDPDPAKAVASAKEAAADIKGWYDKLAADGKKAKENVVSPERQQLDKERADFLKQQEDFKTNQSTEFKNNVAKVCESTNNRSLGAALGPYLRREFFKGFGRENLMPLGNTIKANLYETLKSDQAYQTTMKSMWGSKNPDRQRIEEYHKARVDSIAEQIVRDTVQRMYPGYSRGGAAAGRVAAATEKKAVATKVTKEAIATGRPQYVAVKPKDLDRTRKDSTLLEITGKGYLPNGTFVTWRK